MALPALNIHKTRLNDPFTWFMGTNDQPGDYRHSGCASCHVVYANDREPRHSLIYAQYGRDGQSITADPTIAEKIEHAAGYGEKTGGYGARKQLNGSVDKNAHGAVKQPGHVEEDGHDHDKKDDGALRTASGEVKEKGHPLQHVFTRAIPTSQCMNCHLHQPNIFLNSFLGYTMWDYESDAPAMWPKQQKYPTAAEVRAVNDRNPEGAAPKGNWSDLDFLRNVYDLNPTLKDTQFADYHGHGWNFRAIFKRDREGNLLDKDGAIVDNDDPEKWQSAHCIPFSAWMSIMWTVLPGLTPAGTNSASPFLRHFSGSSGLTTLPSLSSRLPARSRLNTPRKFQPWPW